MVAQQAVDRDHKFSPKWKGPFKVTKIVNMFQVEYEEEGTRKKSNIRYCKKYREEYRLDRAAIKVNQWETRRSDTKRRAQSPVRESEGEFNRESTVDMAALSRVVIKIGKARYFISGLGDLQRLLKRRFDEEETCMIVGYRSATNKPREKRLYYLFKDLLEANSGLRARSRWGDLQERYLPEAERNQVRVPAAGAEAVPEPEPSPEPRNRKE